MNSYFFKNNILLFLALFVLLLAFGCNKSFASCYYVNGYNLSSGTVNIGDATVQRDVPVGTVIKKTTFTGLSSQPNNFVECDDMGALTMKYGDSAYSTFTYNGDTYFNIGVSGYGIRMTSNSNWWQAIWNGGALPILLTGGTCTSAGSNKAWYCGGSFGAGGLNFELVRVPGEAQSGTIITPGHLVKASISGILDVYNIDLAATKITTLACSITTPTLTFPLGSVPISEFGNTVGFIPTETSTQNLGLNCDAGANINVSLNASQNPDVSTPSVVALDNQGGAGTATGLGVQFIYNGSPLEINKNIVLKQSSGGQETFPITARYYQTKTTVTAGDASTSATLTLTYQ